ncbi:hypothetical protein [Azospirillum sp.]|uniref:hypothetical protein n=1 Tax=Azospirillum sp. TaxID=34012 RepID=UPI002D6D72A6|nr:hypothetical protein [Azospirillum sp.]HYD68514.1 hypothetical protein [Azospirillum sp.]
MALSNLTSISDNLYNEAARLSRAVYESETAKAFAHAPGWTPLTSADLPVSTGTLNNGLFENQNGNALVAAAVVDGKRTLAVVFRGSDEREDWIQNFRNIDEHAANFTGLLSAADALVAQGQFDQVLLAGHSLGGAVTQVSMNSLPHAPQLVGVTFGSPGSVTGGADDRLVNFRVANDPIPWLAEHRVDIADFVRSLPPAGQTVVAQRVADLVREDPPLTAQDVLGTLPYMTSNYALRGALVELPGSGGVPLPTSLSVDVTDKLDLSRHGITLYQTFMPTRTTGTDAGESFAGSAAMDDHFGYGGNDTLSGQGGNDALYGNLGDDLLFGGDGDDWMHGGQGGDAVEGGAGNDQLYGGLAGDTVSGAAGADTLFGGQGGDALLGGDGNDVLWGNLGDDTLTGGAGADRFGFGGNSGADVVADFDGAGGDRILLAGGLTYTVQAGTGGVAVLALGTGNTVTLTGVRADQFSSTWVV